MSRTTPSRVSGGFRVGDPISVSELNRVATDAARTRSITNTAGLNSLIDDHGFALMQQPAAEWWIKIDTEDHHSLSTGYLNYYSWKTVYRIPNDAGNIWEVDTAGPFGHWNDDPASGEYYCPAIEVNRRPDVAPGRIVRAWYAMSPDGVVCVMFDAGDQGGEDVTTNYYGDTIINHYDNSTTNYNNTTNVNFIDNSRVTFNSYVFAPNYTVTQFTSNVTNLVLTAALRYYVTSDAEYRHLSSIAPGTNPNGRTIYIRNAGDYTILIDNESTDDATEANRIVTTTGNYYFLMPGHTACLVYSSSLERWCVCENSDERLGKCDSFEGFSGDVDNLDLDPAVEQYILTPESDGLKITGVKWGVPGLRFRFINGSLANSFILVHDSLDSDLTNRFQLPDSEDLTIPPNGEVEIDYGSDNYWRVLGICCGGSGTTYAQFAFKTIAVTGQPDVVADAKDDTLTLAEGDNVTITTDAATDTITISANLPVYAPRWIKRSFTYEDFATAATTNEIELWQIPPGGMVHAAVIKHSTAFAGGSIYAYDIRCGKPGGVPGDDTNLLAAFDVFQAVSGTTFAYSTGTDSDPPYPLFMQNFGTSYSLSIYASCSGDDLDAATQGAVDVWLLVSDVSDAPDDLTGGSGGSGGGGGGNAFGRVLVAGQDDIEADQANDALTLVAGTGINLTTNATTDTLAITCVLDAHDAFYTPTTLADWDGGTDPGNVGDGLDQLAARVTDIESLTYVENLNDLGDVVITAPSNGQVLKYNGTSWINDTDATGGGVPAGAVQMWAGSSLPSGWLACNGAAVSRTTYADLFAAIGTAWGSGDGSTTFNVPDLRGRAPIGVGTGSGLTARTLGQKGGSETHTLTESEMPAHSHDLYFDSAAGGTAIPLAFPGTGTPANFRATTSKGSGAAHNNMQPWAAINFIIKT